MKKRYIILLFVALLILQSAGVLLPSPVRPYIQLPGEVYPGTSVTNTFVASLVAYLIVILIAVFAKARQRTADEVPTGFYNFLEMIVEGAYGFAENIAGSKKVKDFFPFFMTYILFILVSNWMGLLPGVDSIGVWENKPHFTAEKEIKAIETRLESLEAAGETDGLTSYIAQLESTYHVEVHFSDGHLTEESHDELFHEIEHLADEANLGDMQNGIFLTGATANEEGEKPESADWTIVPFIRPAATDLNLTLALALVAMFMVQFYGFKYQGARGYLSKFFPFIAKGYGAQVAKNPIKAIDPAVGLLELVSEISKIISFAFRLLGNIFAGMVLLFVMAYLLPAANIVFFGLEFFVGLIQALVFALLMLIFMAGATESHHGDDEHGHEHH